MITPAASEDTIVALATPPGLSALAVVRLSGPEALRIGDLVFTGRMRLLLAPSRVAQLGVIHRPGEDEPVDQVLALVLRGPRTYTGEDMVEFSAHGGQIASQLVMGALVDGGARPALPGEFTRRAFLNGRIDLIQAEAVADLIHARGIKAVRNAMAQLEGGLSTRIKSIRETILSILAPLEAFIDFGEDVPEAPCGDRLLSGIEAALGGIDVLLGGRDLSRVISEGVTVALVGRPNVGKSSLLNALSGRERALVHHAPGTTRDTIDVEMPLDGVPVRFVDTAGVRRTQDPVESAGVERAAQAARTADLTLLVTDASSSPTEDDREASALVGEGKRLVVRNKIDLGDDAASRMFAMGLGNGVHDVSALTGRGIGQLLESVTDRIRGEEAADEGATMTRARQYEALTRAKGALVRARAALGDHAFADMVAAELRDSLGALGEITGESVGPDILDRIFSTFCIGK
jgi:tRNA modification GTPase